MTNIQITITVGIGYNKHGLPVPPQEASAAKERAKYSLTRVAGGCTTILGTGAWFDDTSGQMVAEPVFIFTVLTDAEKLEGVKEVAASLRDHLEQSCVAVSVIPATVEFI